MTRFLRNCWYAAAWSEELATAPVARTILDQPIALWRNEDGTAFALDDRCPHRFAPLSLGKQVDQGIQCPYHGLVFDMGGSCVANPHGNRSTAGLKVRRYPTVERWGMIWLWPGDPDAADPAEVPDLPFLGDVGYRSSRSHLYVPANYELVVDNLLDLSHVEFLHPFLARPGIGELRQFQAKQTGDTVTSVSDIPDEPPTPLFQLFWDSDAERGNLHSEMRWTAPSNLLLDVVMTPNGSPAGSGPRVPSAHLLTPETMMTTHYFWAVGRNRRLDDHDLDAQLAKGISQAFANEDEPMIRAVQQNMGGPDLMSLRPALLVGDEAAIRARRILAKKISDEASANAE